MYIFSYFTTEEEQLFLARSEDGLNWATVNEGRPLVASEVGTRQLRDPHIIQDQEGLFHMVWTDGWASRSIGYARSRDLKHWEGQKLIPVMEHLELTQNTWAPETFYDSTVEAYRIVWSSTVGKQGRDHRIWSVTTKDFELFTEARLFFDPGYNVIDATVIDRGDHFYMVYKDERGTNDAATANKAMRSCKVDKLGAERDRPEVSEISGLLTPPLTEGPSLYPVVLPEGAGWCMIYDGFHERYYDARVSLDLLEWKPLEKRIELPAGARHGAVLKLEDDLQL
jgi:hypothetical protein